MRALKLAIPLLALPFYLSSTERTKAPAIIEGGRMAPLCTESPVPVCQGSNRDIPPFASSLDHLQYRSSSKRSEDLSVSSESMTQDRRTPSSMDSSSPAQPSSSVDWSKFQGSLPAGSEKNNRNTWIEADSNQFPVRGKSFLQDGQRVPAGAPLGRLVAVDWLRSNSRINHVAAREDSVVQRVAAANPARPPYFFVINMQVPSTQQFSMVFYYAIEAEIEEDSLLHRFIHGDDSFRNSRLNMIPSVPEANWVVKQAAGGKRPVSLARVMQCSYHTGENYIEVDINMGTSPLVRGIMGMVFGFITMVVVDMAWLIKGDTEEELPERLLGAGRLSHLALDAAKQV